MVVASVLVKKSTKSIIKYADYPSAEIVPILDIDPDYEWLIKNIPFPEPDYDSRVFIMQTNLPDLEFLNDFQEHPLYAGIREYRITYTPNKRPNDEIIMAIENAEKEANDSVWSEAVHKNEMARMLNSVHKQGQNITLSVDEQGYINKLAAINMKLAKNLDTKNIKLLQVVNGQEPNIDEGWEKI